MIINNVRIFPTHRGTESNLKATATMVVNNSILLQSIRIMADDKAPDGFRVLYPARRLENGAYRRCFHPSTAESRERLDGIILQAFQNSLDNPENNTFEVDPSVETVYEITNSAIYPYLNSDTQARAKVNLELDGELWLHGMYLTVRADGSLYLRMPGRQLEGGRWMDYFHPLSQEARNFLTQAAMPHYETALHDARAASKAANGRRVFV